MPRTLFPAILLAAALFAPLPVRAGDIDNRYTTPEYSGPNARITNDVQRPNSLIRRDPVTNGFELRDKPATIDATEARARILRDRMQQESVERAQRYRDLDIPVKVNE